MTRLEPPRWSPPYTRGVLLALVALAIAALAVAVLVLARYGWTPAPDRVLAARVLLGLMVLGAATFLVTACVVYAGSLTRLEFDATGLRLTQPFRAWSGAWSRIRRAYVNRRLLVIEPVDRRWFSWTIPVPADRLAVLDELRAHLGSGVWLDEARAEHLLGRRRTLAITIGTALALIVAWVTWPVLNWR